MATEVKDKLVKLQILKAVKDTHDAQIFQNQFDNDKNRHVLMKNTITDTGKAVNAQNIPISYESSIQVVNGSEKHTYSGRIAPMFSGNTAYLMVNGAPDGTTYQWQFYSSGWKNVTNSSMSGSGTSGTTYRMLLNGTQGSPKRISNRYRCMLNGTYATDEYTFIDTSWRDVDPAVTIDGSTVTVTKHNMGKAPEGLMYNVKVNGISAGIIAYDSDASKRTLNLETELADTDIVEVVPYVDINVTNVADLALVDAELALALIDELGGNE